MQTNAHGLGLLGGESSLAIATLCAVLRSYSKQGNLPNTTSCERLAVPCGNGFYCGFYIGSGIF